MLVWLFCARQRGLFCTPAFTHSSKRGLSGAPFCRSAAPNCNCSIPPFARVRSLRVGHPAVTRISGGA